MKAMVLAAGLGTRLAPLTDERAKPLVWVGDRPALAHVASSLARAGATEVVVNVHHRPEDFEGIDVGVPLRLVHEPRILGTAGGVAGAAELLGEGDVTVWNGDVLADPDLIGLVRAQAASKAAATLVVSPRPRGEGTVGLGAGGRVVRLRGRVFGEEVAGSDYLGVQRIAAATRARLPREGCLVGDVYLPILAEGGLVATYAHEGDWIDVGALASYVAANVRWLAQQGRVAWADPSARVSESVELAGSVVLAGAVVEGEGRLEHVVVWPGARVRAPLARAVVTTKRTVILDA